MMVLIPEVLLFLRKVKITSTLNLGKSTKISQIPCIPQIWMYFHYFLVNTQLQHAHKLKHSHVGCLKQILIIAANYYELFVIVKNCS